MYDTDESHDPEPSFLGIAYDPASLIRDFDSAKDLSAVIERAITTAQNPLCCSSTLKELA